MDAIAAIVVAVVAVIVVVAPLVGHRVRCVLRRRGCGGVAVARKVGATADSREAIPRGLRRVIAERIESRDG